MNEVVLWCRIRVGGGRCDENILRRFTRNLVHTDDTVTLQCNIVKVRMLTCCILIHSYMYMRIECCVQDSWPRLALVSELAAADWHEPMHSAASHYAVIQYPRERTARLAMRLVIIPSS